MPISCVCSVASEAIYMWECPFYSPKCLGKNFFGGLFLQFIKWLPIRLCRGCTTDAEQKLCRFSPNITNVSIGIENEIVTITTLARKGSVPHFECLNKVKGLEPRPPSPLWFWRLCACWVCRWMNEWMDWWYSAVFIIVFRSSIQSLSVAVLVTSLPLSYCLSVRQRFVVSDWLLVKHSLLLLQLWSCC